MDVIDYIAATICILVVAGYLQEAEDRYDARLAELQAQLDRVEMACSPEDPNARR